METVMALEQGFAWNGTTYPSLSAVAFAITGTKWNGHRFFGLRGRQNGPAADAVRTERIAASSRPKLRAAQPAVGVHP